MTGLRQQFIDRQTTSSGRRFTFDTLRVFVLASGGAAAFLFDESSPVLRALIAAAWVLVVVVLAAAIVTRIRFGGAAALEADGDQASGSESDGL